MADFRKAILLVIGDEDGKLSGVTTDDKDDNGGLTQWGLSKKNHPELNIGHLTLEEAIAAYDKIYRKALRFDEILSDSEANSILNDAVLHGTTGAVKITQETLGVPITGHMDDLTLNTLNGKA